MKNKVILLMGSEKDLELCKEIVTHLNALKLDHEMRVGSAHKTPENVLKILKEYENANVIYVTVAGRSNTLKPVIACPPYSEKYGGADIYSSLRVPSGVAPLVTVEPEAAALAAAKIFALQDKTLEKRIIELQEAKKREVEKADEKIKKLK
jgi:5-(carboxyamino)imidazole ribonucleotide mutase